MNDRLMNVVKKDKKKMILLLALAVIAVFLLVIGSQWENDRGGQTDMAESPTIGESGDTESELSALLSQIAGAGKVEVMIYRDDDGENIYAYNEETKTSSSSDGTTEQSEHRELVLLDGDSAPVVISERKGTVVGVLVVAEGAADDNVRASLVDAVASYLHIGKNRIEVTPMEVH